MCLYVYVYIHISSIWGCLDPYKDKIAKLQKHIKLGDTDSASGFRVQLLHPRKGPRKITPQTPNPRKLQPFWSREPQPFGFFR